MSTLPDRLHAARVLARLSQEELAERMGISVSTIHRREKGEAKATADMVLQTAEATGVPVAWLVDGFTQEQIDEPLGEVLKRLREPGPQAVPDPPAGSQLSD